jgi:hypothetical protein
MVPSRPTGKNAKKSPKVKGNGPTPAGRQQTSFLSVLTPDGAPVVTVAKVKKETVELLRNTPTRDLTQAQFAQASGLPELAVVWSKLDKLVSTRKLTKTWPKRCGRAVPRVSTKEGNQDPARILQCGFASPFTQSKDYETTLSPPKWGVHSG